MRVELRNISEIQPYPDNPRINEQAVAAVAASIREFGFRQPIVVTEQGVIVVGHTRYKAALQLGLTKVPVHVATDLTPAQIKAYRLADNKTAELAEWDDELLTQELAELQGLDFDLDLLGFPTDELNQLLHRDLAPGLVDPDHIPEPPDPAITQPGDLWILGEHRVLCGDAAKPEALDRLLAGAPVHLVNTDPPYNVCVEPRSNNAIAAGLSSFATKHHQRFDSRAPAGQSDSDAPEVARQRPSPGQRLCIG
jgi:ParB-like chromosome segregation protein Spo0J